MFETNLPRVVIVGAGFGGLSCAKALKRAAAEISVVDKTNYHLFQPLLYQVATAGLSPAEIASPVRSILRGQRNTHVLMAEVSRVDWKEQRVWMGDRHLDYDYLVLATGAVSTYFGQSNWGEHAPSLKTLPDATAIRRKILLAFERAEMEEDPKLRDEWLTFVLVGGGPTGVEMAGAIAEISRRALAKDFHSIDPRSAKIYLIEAGPRILSSFPQKLAEAAKRSLQNLGVQVLEKTRVEKMEAGGVTLEGKFLASRTLLWTAGVAATPVAKWLGVEGDKSGRVRVGPDLSVAERPNIYVIGDVALAHDPSGKPLPGVAPVAMQEGKYVANVIGKRISKSSGAPRPFRYVDKGNLATVGRGFAIVDLGWWQLQGRVAWFAWLGVHIYYLIGFRNRMIVFVQWAWAYLTFQRGARLILGEKTEKTD